MLFWNSMVRNTFSSILFLFYFCLLTCQCFKQYKASKHSKVFLCLSTWIYSKGKVFLSTLCLHAHRSVFIGSQSCEEESSRSICKPLRWELIKNRSYLIENSMQLLLLFCVLYGSHLLNSTLLTISLKGRFFIDHFLLVTLAPRSQVWIYEPISSL